jgi:DNA-binding response OmpR family regulator
VTKILIAEDEPDIQRLIKLALSHTGYRFLSATDGQMAYALALKEIPDLILMDVQLPQLNGYEACRRIKAEATLQHVAVVFLSALGAAANVQAGFASGAAAYLRKPFRLDELTRTVAEILSRRVVPGPV